MARVRDKSKSSKKDRSTAEIANFKKGMGDDVSNDPSKDLAGDIEETTEEKIVEPVEILGPDSDESANLPADDLVVEAVDIETDNTDNRSSRDLVTVDPLTRYLQEASRHAPLTREEEFALAVKYHNDHDRDAAYKIIVGNLWLVIKVSREYERAAKNLLDLIQEGNIGLMEAVKSFDPYRGVRFPSYAVWWIKAYIIRYIIANWRMVKIGTTQAQRKLFFNLRKEKERLEREGFLPAPKLLAERLNVKEDEVVEMEQRLGSSEMSVDAPLQDDNEQTLHGVLASPEQSIEESLAKSELRSLLSKSFDEFEKLLNDKERVIFRERMLGDEKVTLQDISEKLSISRERVRQIENRLKERLKSFLSEKLGDELPEDMEIY